jgi:hypothetical protein
MSNNGRLLVAALLGILAQANAQTNKNEMFRPGKLWMDNNGVYINAHGGGILFDRGTYYWFGEHKIEGGAGNAAKVGVHCYSSTNLYAWKDEGIALAVNTADPAAEIAKGCLIERPKVVYNAKTAKYVMWFHLELKGKGYAAARAAVAVSERVTGPYRYLRSYRPNANVWPMGVTARDTLPEEVKPTTGENTTDREKAINGYFLRRDFRVGQMARDMTIFGDDDAKAYLVYAAEENLTLNIAELTDNYTSFTGRWKRLFAGGHNEAPAMFKTNGKYYLITSGCTGWDPNAARSAVASSIWGPWNELGNPCVGADSALTFHSQSTHVLPVAGLKDAFIFMADRWTPRNAIDGRYIWLPVQFVGDTIRLSWKEEWDLSVFTKK